MRHYTRIGKFSVLPASRLCTWGTSRPSSLARTVVFRLELVKKQDTKRKAGMESVDSARTAVVPEGEEEIDPWGAEDDDVEHSSSTQSLDLQREWEARRLQFHNLGYRDGITAGNNSSVQEGFDVGFQEAVRPAFSWGVARGAASAYTSLPSSLRELLLKDREAGKRLEALHSTLSSISSADAMGMYYKDIALRKGRTPEDSLRGHSSEASQNILSRKTQIEEEKFATQSESGDTTNACCGGGFCGDSRACSTQAVDGLSITAQQSELDGITPSASNDAPERNSGREPISDEAYKFILKVGTSADDAKQLEDSTTSQLVSMALGHPGPSTSTSTASELSIGLVQYQRNVSAQLEKSDVKLSCFPQSSTAILTSGNN